MSEIRLFRTTGSVAVEIAGTASSLERPLQTLMEANLEQMLGIRFLGSEFSTGKIHGGRIDTLGIDEDNSPVIIEYKRSVNENVLSQGLFYLDWLMDHKAEFELLVLKRLGKKAADKIDWTAPRLVCIAADFTRYDAHAVQQMDRDIDLIRYRKFGKDLILLEQITPAATTSSTANRATSSKVTGKDKSVAARLKGLSPAMRDLFVSVEDFLISLGDDVQRKDLKLYVAFKRLRNFASVCFQKRHLVLFLTLNPDRVKPISGITRDVRSVGHWGTGDLEVTLTTQADLELVKPLLALAYQGGNHPG